MQRPPPQTVSQSKILVLYTGGTIGCLNTERGLTVQPGFLSVSEGKVDVELGELTTMTSRIGYVRKALSTIPTPELQVRPVPPGRPLPDLGPRPSPRR